MLVDIVMPKMGESIMDGKILKWYKKPGDTIGKDETLLEISTDKVDTEVPSAEGGVVTELLFGENDTANVGDVIARIETDPTKAKISGGSKGSSSSNGNQKPSSSLTAQAGVEKAEEEIEKQEIQEELNESINEPPFQNVSKPEPKTHSGNGEHKGGGAGFYSPLVMNIASKENVSMDELSSIKGTGIGGRVRKQDILAFVEDKKSGKTTQVRTQPTSGLTAQAGGQKQETFPLKAVPIQTKEKRVTPPQKIPETSISKEHTEFYNMPGVDVVPMDQLQEKMAEHMVRSVHTSPHVTAIAEADMSAVDVVRKSMEAEFIKREGFKLTFMPFICEAVVKAIKDFPLINSSVDDKNILVKNFINLGIAVAMDNGGLIVPVIKNADSKNLVGLARDINDLAKRARIKKLTLDEIQNGTFTITNYGIFGNIIGTPIINQPQVAILGTGAIKKRAVVLETAEGDAIVIKPVMYLTLAFDHRIIDGALGGKFLMKIVEYIENYTI